MKLLSNLTLADEDRPILLEKRIKLLIAVEEEGSILKAAKKVPMSYKSAWEAIDAMNNLSKHPIVQTETGGFGGGGTKLTPYAKELIDTYNIFKLEQERFLEILSQKIDINNGRVKTLRRLAMEISARNQIRGVVDKVVKSDVNANIVVVPKSGHEIIANISRNSAESLDIKEGDEVVAIFKSSNVLLAISEDIAISARNKIKGKISKIVKSSTNSEVVIDIGGESIASIVTTGAVKRLALKEQNDVVAFIKSNDIMIGK